MTNCPITGRIEKSANILHIIFGVTGHWLNITFANTEGRNSFHWQSLGFEEFQKWSSLSSIYNLHLSSTEVAVVKSVSQIQKKLQGRHEPAVWHTLPPWPICFCKGKLQPRCYCTYTTQGNQQIISFLFVDFVAQPCSVFFVTCIPLILIMRLHYVKILELSNKDGYSTSSNLLYA